MNFWVGKFGKRKRTEEKAGCFRSYLGKKKQQKDTAEKGAKTGGRESRANEKKRSLEKKTVGVGRRNLLEKGW